MTNTDIETILKRPYRRILVPDPESGIVTATIPEFPGCIAEGDSASKALVNLERVAQSWVQSLLSRGVNIPEPLGERDFSGRFPLRLPISLHERIAEMAEQDGVSLNTFIVTVLSERAGFRHAEDSFRQALKQLSGPRLVLMQDVPAWGSVGVGDDWDTQASTAVLPPAATADVSARRVLRGSEG
jgi:predicted RNase H-like HicB family nuclease